MVYLGIEIKQIGVSKELTHYTPRKFGSLKSLTLYLLLFFKSKIPYLSFFLFSYLTKYIHPPISSHVCLVGIPIIVSLNLKHNQILLIVTRSPRLEVQKNNNKNKITVKDSNPVSDQTRSKIEIGFIETRCVNPIHRLILVWGYIC